MLIRTCAVVASAVSLLSLTACDVVKSTSRPVGPSVAATVNGVKISESQVEMVFEQGGAKDRSGDPALRARVIDQLVVQLIASKEATKKGLDKDAEVKEQLDMARQSILATAFIKDYLKKNPVTDGDLKSEYDKVKASMGASEYKARHILVKNEADAVAIIAKLNKSPKVFESLAKDRSIDPGSKAGGGDLGWFDPQAMVPEFADALAKLQKGQFTQAPVKSEFGYHVILLEDSREKQFPPLEVVKSNLEQQLQKKKLADLLDGMKSGAKIAISKPVGEDSKVDAKDSK